MTPRRVLRSRSQIIGLFGERKPYVGGRLTAYRMLRHADLTRSVHSSPPVPTPHSLSLAGGVDVAPEPFSSFGVPAATSPQEVEA